jgi:hypothetical protein
MGFEPIGLQSEFQVWLIFHTIPTLQAWPGAISALGVVCEKINYWFFLIFSSGPFTRIPITETWNPFQSVNPNRRQPPPAPRVLMAATNRTILNPLVNGPFQADAYPLLISSCFKTPELGILRPRYRPPNLSCAPRECIEMGDAKSSKYPPFDREENSLLTDHEIVS